MAAAIIIALAAPSLRAQDSWAPVRETDQGTAVVVTTLQGSRFSGAIQAATDEQLVVADAAGERGIARTNVRTVSASIRDSVWNGVLLGAAAGFGGGAALGTAWFYGSGHYGAKPPGYAPGFVTGVGVVGAVAGALAGWRVDRGRMRASVIYEVAPEP